MFGQFLMEPALELELPEPDEAEPEPELVELEVPVFAVVGLDEDGVVDDPVFEVAPVLVLGVELDVVAALATNAPPARRPVVNAPTTSTFRKRKCIGYAFRLWCKALRSGAPSACALDLGTAAERTRRVCGVALRTGDNSQEASSPRSAGQPHRASRSSPVESVALRGSPAVRAHGYAQHLLSAELVEAVQVPRHRSEVGVTGVGVHSDH